jgi:hypothetical protein
VLRLINLTKVTRVYRTQDPAPLSCDCASSSNSKARQDA